jgi:flagellar basal-body rod protein FlgC
MEISSAWNNGIMGSFLISDERGLKMIASMDNTVAALKAFSRKMGVTADNVANVNTDSFKKRNATLQEGKNGDVRVNITKDKSPGIIYETVEGGRMVPKETSNVNLAEEFPDMLNIQNSYAANLKVLKAQDEMVGNLLDTIV